MTRRKGGQVPYDELGYAIRWEQCRARYFQDKQKFFEAQECAGLARMYERRSQTESDALFA